MPVLKNGELYLYGFVGDILFDEGFTASEVIDALALHGPGPVTVHINSGGGYASDGIAIYNLLVAHPGDVTVIVDAMAASSASLIAMAGSQRIMREGAMMMVHEPVNWLGGTADDHTKSAEELNKLGDSMAGIYSGRSDVDARQMRIEMKDTLWLTPDEAVERGLATAANDDGSSSVAAFDYRIYAHAPQKLCALASEHQWSLKAALAQKGVASASPITGHKGVTELSKIEDAGKSTATSPVPVKTEIPAQDSVATANADTETAVAVNAAVAADRERRGQILALDEAKGREALAESLFATEMSVANIKAALAAAPAGAGNEASTTPDDYERERTQSNGLALPGKNANGHKATIDRAAIFATRREQVERN